MSKLSVIIIVKNEAQNIIDCLESIKWADEIIIVDSDSTDNTIELCKKYTDKTFNHAWQGFGIQKNYALSRATKEWVLSIDADERVTPELAKEIQQIIKANPQNVAYKIRRRNFYCGKEIKHMRSWVKDTPLRLFKKMDANFSDDLVHEKIITNSQIRQLDNAMLHYSYQSLEQVLNTMNSYSTLGAEKMFKNNKKATIFSAIMHYIWSFMKDYLLGLGFLDGAHGFLLAKTNADGCFYKYAKLTQK